MKNFENLWKKIFKFILGEKNNAQVEEFIELESKHSTKLDEKYLLDKLLKKN